jgi:hypothetical protein
MASTSSDSPVANLGPPVNPRGFEMTHSCDVGLREIATLRSRIWPPAGLAPNQADQTVGGEDSVVGPRP